MFDISEDINHSFLTLENTRCDLVSHFYIGSKAWMTAKVMVYARRHGFQYRALLYFSLTRMAGSGTNYWNTSCRLTLKYSAEIGTTQVFMLSLLLLKPAAQAQVGKTKVLINCLSSPTSTCHRKTEKQTQGSNQGLTFRCQTLCWEGHSTHESAGPTGNTLHIGTFNTLILQTLMDELQPQLGCVKHW